MGFLLSGFAVSQNVKLQNAITTAGRAVNVAYEKMKGIKATNKPDKAYMDFFGAVDAGRINTVWTRMNMIQYAMNSSFIRYNRSIGRPGTYAAAQKPASGWSEKNVRQILDQGEFTMKIDDAFYGAGTDKHVAALTIVHEISHLVANTDDETCPWDGEDCYELDRCRRLANQYPSLAISNADSYGYFVMAEYSFIQPRAKAEETDVDISALFG